MLWSTRDGLVATGHVRLRDLARFDERIAAHQDACLVGGDPALRVLIAQLADISAGRIFAVVVAAIDLEDRGTIARCLALAQTSPEAYHGMAAAMGWVSSVRLKGIVKDLLVASSPKQHRLGLSTCRLHGVDPGAPIVAALKNPDSDVRSEAVRTVGVLGRADLLSPGYLDDENPSCLFWSAWSGVLLGDRDGALNTLTTIGLSGGLHQARAFRLACQSMSTTAAYEMLRNLTAEPNEVPRVIEGSGIVGDPVYVPWLIRQMASVKLARAAGAAFALITGIDLSESGLEGVQPEEFEPGPSDDPEDANVEMDADEGLPWPDAPKIEKWWDANSSRFVKGTRYFMGQPVTKEHCIHVLKTGYQRQRILAAHYLCLLEPGTPLFNTSAPAWRQQRLLAKM